MINLERTDSDNPFFRDLVASLDRDLRERYGELQSTYDTFNKIDYLDTVVIANLQGLPVGCGCFKRYDGNTVEVKRMFVSKDHRGRGIASAILRELEDWAREKGYAAMVLETAIRQPEAIALYKKKGYKEIPNYGPYTGMSESVCMKKILMEG